LLGQFSEVEALGEYLTGNIFNGMAVRLLPDIGATTGG
jgi:hypothetical protein